MFVYEVHEETFNCDQKRVHMEVSTNLIYAQTDHLTSNIGRVNIIKSMLEKYMISKQPIKISSQWSSFDTEVK